MHSKKSTFVRICLCLTCIIALLWAIELLPKHLWRSQCICQVCDNESKETGCVVSNESAVTSESANDKENDRILIWVLTGPSRHMTHIVHVQRTWGLYFNKLLFMSSTADERVGTIALPNVTEGHDKLWPKTQKAFRYVWEHHKDDADWFMKADDDTFIVSHNLREFLKDLNPHEPHYFGFTFKWPEVPVPVNYGGTGYILSKAALRLFLQALDRGGDCHQEIRKKHKGDEDIELGICMASVNVTAEGAVDAQGQEQMILEDNFEDFDNVVANFNGTWPDGWNNRTYSPKAISFHKLSLSQMYLLDHLVYKMKLF